MVVVRFLKNIGSVFFYTGDFVFRAWPRCSCYTARFSLNLKV